jgi:hypothetical protein
LTTPEKHPLSANFHVEWSAEDGEYVGLCYRFPSLSWIDPDPIDAMIGIMRLVDDV